MNKALLEKLISYRTTEDQYDQQRNCIEYLKNYLIKNGLKVKVFENNRVFSLLAGKKIKRMYRLLLNGHLDVVPASKSMFKPKYLKNKLIARGASDMKTQVAVMIETLIKFSKKSEDIALLVTTDEEIGGFDGSRFMVEDFGLSSECVFIPDTVAGYKVLLEAKGVIQAKISARGKSHHGSTPWLGENAIEKLVNIFNKIKEYFGEADEKDNWKVTVNLGKISGGEATNQVPGKAEMYIDIRFPSTTTKSELMNMIRKLCETERDTNVEVLIEGDPVHISRDSKYIKFISESIKKYTGTQPDYINEEGASDARFFAAKGMDVVMVNPISGGDHSEDEWVDIDELKIYERILDDFVSKSLV